MIIRALTLTQRSSEAPHLTSPHLSQAHTSIDFILCSSASSLSLSAFSRSSPTLTVSDWA